MKKRILTLILCGVLSTSLIAGCGKNDGEIKQKEETGETLIETKPVEVPDDTPENTSVSSEPASEDGDVETKLPGPDEEPLVPETSHAPEVYEEYPAVSYDDSFEREHAYNTVVCGEDYKLWVSVSSYGTNRTDKTASGAVNYTLYTVDGSKNHLTADDFTAEYIGELKNLTITGIDSAATDADDKVVICVSVSLSDVTGDEIIFENDFQLIDKDGDIVEKKFNWD